MKIILNTFYTKESELRKWKDVQNQLIVHFTGKEGFPDSSVGKEFTCNAEDPQFDSWVRKIPWRRDRLPTPAFLGFPCRSAGKESACNVGDLGLIPGLGRSPGEGKDYPLQYPGLENSTDCIVHGVAKSWTQLSDIHFQFSTVWATTKARSKAMAVVMENGKKEEH